MKMPCELIVTHILPTARGALAKELVHNHGMTQVQVANLFGVTSAAVSQYIKGLRGGNNLIDKSAYREDFYKPGARTSRWHCARSAPSSRRADCSRPSTSTRGTAVSSGSAWNAPRPPSPSPRDWSERRGRARFIYWLDLLGTLT